MEVPTFIQSGLEEDPNILKKTSGHTNKRVFSFEVNDFFSPTVVH